MISVGQVDRSGVRPRPDDATAREAVPRQGRFSFAAGPGPGTPPAEPLPVWIDDRSAAGLRMAAAARAASYAAERLAWAVLISVEGLGPVGFERLVRSFGSAAAVVAAAGEAGAVSRLLEAGSGSRPLQPEVALDIIRAAEAAPAFALRLAATGVSILTLDDPWYPSRLRTLEMPPPVLFVRGSPAALDRERAAAVVGTRRPTERGRRFATALSTALAGNGATIVSGLALGIDGAAHAACVEAGRPTVAVLGGGHGHLYPSAHAPLADRIVAGGGAVISELAPDVPAVAGTFPRRNRVIAGLADATVVVEAGERSGALITAGWALEQGRDCFVVPGPIDAAQSVGCNRLLRLYPGQAKAVPGVAELLEDLGWTGAPTIDEVTPDEHVAPLVHAPSNDHQQAGDHTGSDERRVPRHRAGAPGPGLDAVLASLGTTEALIARTIHRRSATLDGLIVATGLAPAAVLAVLTRLEDRGLTVPVLGRYAPAGLLAAVPPVPDRSA